MTEPSQYFKGRTVQEQMNEVIGYVDVRAEEVAAAKADDVLEPAEAAKDAAQAAQAAAETAKAGAEAARDATLAALPAVNERIDDVESDLNDVTLRVTTAEGNIITIDGKITSIETKNNQQDTAIAALQTADAQNVKINSINDYAVGLTGNQDNIAGEKIFINQYRGMRGFILKSNANQYYRMAEFDGNVGGNGSIVFIVATRGTFGMFRVNISIDSSTHTVTVGSDASNKILTVTDTIKIGIDYDATANVYRILYAAVTNNVSIHLDIMHATIGTGNNLSITNKIIENVTPDASLSEVTI